MHDMDTVLKFFQNRLDSPLEDLRVVFDKALSRGGEFAEIYLEHRSHSLVNMEEDIIKETAENISLGLGIRVLCGDKTGYGYTNDLRPERIVKAAETAAAIADLSPSRSSEPLARQVYRHNFYPVRRPFHTQPLETRITLVRECYQAAQDFHPVIKKVKVTLTDQIQQIAVLNSEGLMIADRRPLVQLTCTAISEKNSDREAGFSAGGGRIGLDYFEKVLTPEQIGHDAAEEAAQLLDARPAPAGEMPVVLSPGHSGVLIHEAVGHLLEADFNRKKTSVFWNKMGRIVAGEQVTIFDDPTIPHYRGSYNMDDEGTLPRKTLLIEKGRMAGLLMDRLSASLMGRSLTGHARRQDFSCIPMPRMSNTYIAGGEYDPAEIIRSVRRGFFAHKFQGGQVEDSGKFTFSVSSGFLIENGRLTAPVKQASLIGSNIDILKKITRVGSDLRFGLQSGSCGKEGQSAPVTDGCPTLKISGMTVGGRH